MEVDKNEWNIIHKALNEWKLSGKLTAQQADELKKDVVCKTSERQQVAQYFFIIALSCMLLAFGAIFIDDKFLEKIKKYFDLNNLIIAVGTGIITSAWFWYIRKRGIKYTPIIYEIYMTLGGLGVLTCLVYICKEISTGTSYAPFLAIAAILLFALSLLFKSKALWLGGILGFMGWFGIFSYNHSIDNLFIGMNYPMRFTAFGILILVLSFFQYRITILRYSQSLTFIAGLFIFFTGLWGVSIFGNYNSMAEWEKVRQVHELFYAILLGIISVLTLYAGIRYKNETARNFGIMFLLINIYTRYFEYFWDTMNKGIFFLILGAAFWLTGRWLEKNKTKLHHLQE